MMKKNHYMFSIVFQAYLFVSKDSKSFHNIIDMSQNNTLLRNMGTKYFKYFNLDTVFLTQSRLCPYEIKFR